MSNFVQLFIDNFATGLPAAAIKLVPDRVRRDIVAKCGDFLPFENISSNRDLLRAARLSWIGAANVIRRAVHVQVGGQGPRRDPVVLEFDAVLRENLLVARSQAFNRYVEPPASPIDGDVQAILDGAAEFISPNRPDNIGDRLNSRFETVLAKLTRWDPEPVPTIYGSTATRGVLTEGSTVARSFGELVFASFADLIKDPKTYFEAREAFYIAMQKRSLDELKESKVSLEQMRQSFQDGMEELRATLVQNTVVALKHFEPGIVSIMDRLDATAVLQEGLETYLQQQWVQLQRIEDKIDDLIARTSQAEGVSVTLLKTVLEEMGAHAQKLSIPELEQRFMEMARHYRQLVDRLNHLSNDDPVVVSLRHAASEHLDAGLFAQADAKLAAAEARDLAGIEEVEQIGRQKRLSAAASRAARGDAAIIQGSLNAHRQAVLHFAEARAIARPASAEMAHRYGINQGQALFWLGSIFGRNAELREAAAHFEAMQAEIVDRSDRSEALGELGRVYVTLGRRETGTELLEKAVKAFRDAIDAHHEAKGVEDWADTHLHLGDALRDLAQRQRRLQDRAVTLTDIGHTLLVTGERMGDAANRQAVAAYREALDLLSFEAAPLRNAAALHNLGKALLDIGEEKEGLRYLEESVVAHRKVLTEETRRRYSYDWAVAQNNFGILLRFLSRREGGGQAGLREAVEAHRLALTELTPERSPVESANTHVVFGNALVELGEQSDDQSTFPRAISSYKLALEAFKGQLIGGWAGTWSNMGYAFRAHALSHLKKNERVAATPLLQQAVDAYREAIAAYTVQGHAYSLQTAEAEMATCVRLMAEN